MFHFDLHALGIDLDMTRDGFDQIISKRIELGGREIGAIVNQDKMQALLRAICTMLFSK